VVNKVVTGVFYLLAKLMPRKMAIAQPHRGIIKDHCGNIKNTMHHTHNINTLIY